MKRFLLIGLFFIGMAAVSDAQTDDIYATGADQRGSQSADSNNHNKYSRDDGNDAPDNYQSYNSGDDYVDYDDDSYSSRINRFEYPFYNMGYYSTFYNPFWYNPFWVDPYWGWNPWYPSVGISFGYGPYWSSWWGWNSWYGYGGFASCWSYPYYAGGWYGHGCNGYWNRVYAGVDGRRGSRYNSVGYGPRQAMGNRVGNRVASTGYRNSHANQVGLRSAPLAMATRSSNVMRGGGNPGTRYNNQVSRRGVFGGNRMQQGQGQRAIGNQNARGNGGGRSFFGGGNNNNRAFGGNRGGGNVFQGGGNRSSGAPMHNFGGGGMRSSGGGGGARSFGGGGGARSSGGGGGARSGGGGHSGGGGRR